MNTTISLALIVRDSSATLDRCLSTFKEIADEIVIVDTGSVDNTIEIARKYTDKIYHFKWIDDFSAARNFSFEKCTMETIFWCDSDDYVLPEDVQKIKDFDFSNRDIVICNYVYAHDDLGNSICNVPRERWVRRDLGLRWCDRIHEYLPLNTRPGEGRLFTSDISTHHNKQHGTSERNLAILEEVVKTNPSPRSLYYLGKEYFEMGRIDDGIVYLERFVASPDGWWEDRYQAYYKLASSYMGKNDEAKFKENVYKSIAIEERWAEPYNLLGLYYLNKQQWDKAIFWYEAALNVKRPKGLLAYYQPEYYTWLPALNLALSYNGIGDMKKANEYNKKVLEYRPTDSRALNNDKILTEALKAQKTLENPKKNGQGKRLNLGCGNKAVPGYTNVDLFKGPIVDEIFSMDDIPYMDGTIEAIHSEHSLEHLPFKKAEAALKEWHRVLKPGGEIFLKIPDLNGCCEEYVNAKDKFSRWWYKATIYGIQESQAGEADESQIHMCGFSAEEIGEVLERNGFIIDPIEKYDGYRTPSLSIHAIKCVSKIRVGWVAPLNWEAAQTRIRVLNVNSWLRDRGFMSNIITGGYDDVINFNFDIAVVGKSFSEQDIEGIKMLKRAGKTVYFDACESLFEFPYFKETLAVCDKVLCCSPVLAEQCRTVNDNVVVIEDAFETT